MLYRRLLKSVQSPCWSEPPRQDAPNINSTRALSLRHFRLPEVFHATRQSTQASKETLSLSHRADTTSCQLHNRFFKIPKGHKNTKKHLQTKTRKQPPFLKHEVESPDIFFSFSLESGCHGSRKFTGTPPAISERNILQRPSRIRWFHCMSLC